jgi:hypothetical protein
MACPLWTSTQRVGSSSAFFVSTFFASTRLVAPMKSALPELRLSFPVEPHSPGGATPNVSPGRKTWETFPNDNYPEPCKGGTKHAALYFSAYTPLFRFPRTHFPTSNRQANKGRGSPRLRESQPDEQRKNITPRLRLAVVSSPRAIGKYKISDKGLATRH